MNSDVHYFARRACEEREAAMRAPHVRARAAHLELARRYQERVDGIARRTLNTRFDVAGVA